MRREEIHKTLNVLGITDMVLFKGTEITIRIAKDPNKDLEKSLMADDYYALGITVKKTMPDHRYQVGDFYKTGVLLNVKSIKLEQGFYVLDVKALEKIKVGQFFELENDLKASYNFEEDVVDMDEATLHEMLKTIKKQVKEISVYFKGSEPFVQYLEELDDLPLMCGVLLQYMQVKIEDKQAIFETYSYSDKGMKMIDLLIKQKELFAFQKEISEKFSTEANKNYRKAFLREQLKAIQEELNESEGGSNKQDFRERIEASLMPEETKKIAFDELTKFEGLSPQSAERNVVVNYLELLLALPWGKHKAKEIDIEEARKVLDSEHYGLKEVKDRIIQHLAVMKLKKEKQGSILLLVGPPGTGKTSLGKSIANALDRPYVRMSLGGIRDEAEIRGHRRTYVAALPGRIIQGMKKAGQTNPVFILDEVDKLMVGNSGDPASALLEVLDPEQNNTFADHFLEVPYDLSDVFFIATANNLRGIPGPLLDRMEVIQLSSYTNQEKFHIAVDHLVNNVLEEHGLSSYQLQYSDEAILKIIGDYTREAGVRGLKRELASVARVATEKIVLGEVDLPLVVDEFKVEEFLGRPKARHDLIGKNNACGVVTGLAWTPVGGDILFIEGSFMPGNGQMILTGQLGDVMKESARIALSLVKSRLAFQTTNFEFAKKDLHIHVPSGAIQKDGPSAGVALFSAISSLVLGRKVPSDIAMTGEVTLRGMVMPVGGIKEKIIAAHRAGVKKVLIPTENMKDLKDIPSEVTDEIVFKPMDTIEEVIKELFDLDLPKDQLLQAQVLGEIHGSL
ncbi:endopeptidase La [Fusibacter ferrireducens]|uniref:Lon protease n=1 Tax=Fusibacter ferrireducens TaxID=2785058 RepID=A0ABR9ZQY9_9FIRM|nr:endopeptidase La [Fusibacter ferrireducens]MBF4692877.1 endopeptidase La [Fusibacter ferrireducens]